MVCGKNTGNVKIVTAQFAPDIAERLAKVKGISGTF
jgi:hypothetical protein